jgi:hypothetical protein
MSKKIAAPEPELQNKSKESDRLLRAMGGSESRDWSLMLGEQALGSVCLETDPERRDAQTRAVVAALVGIKPADELEAMLCVQMIACHSAAMQSFGLAASPGQTFEGVREFLTQANKLSRTYATLVEALNRHRGKGVQKVTVEHVHVHEGGQAIVGNVEHPGGSKAKSTDQPHAQQIAHAPQPTVWRTDQERDPVPVPSDAERPLPDARRTVTRSAEGK